METEKRKEGREGIGRRKESKVQKGWRRRKGRKAEMG